MATVTDNINIINNIAATVVPIERLITGAAYIIGIAFAFKAIHSLRQYGESRSLHSGHSSMKEPLIYLLVAGVFIYFPTALAIILNTAFGSPNILAYSEVNSTNPALTSLFGTGSLVGQSLTLIIQAIGAIAFIRGWILIARSSSQGQQPGGTGKGMVHVFGGIIAMNIVLTLQIINNTLYG